MKKNKNVPINKGHFDLDEQSRIKNFQENLGKGWKKE